MVLKNILGIGILGTLITLMATLIKGLVNSGLYNPSTFPTVISGTMDNLYLWGGALGGVVPALLGILFIFVTMRIVVTLL